MAARAKRPRAARRGPLGAPGRSLSRASGGAAGVRGERAAAPLPAAAGPASQSARGGGRWRLQRRPWRAAPGKGGGPGGLRLPGKGPGIPGFRGASRRRAQARRRTVAPAGPGPPGSTVLNKKENGLSRITINLELLTMSPNIFVIS
ncbi:cuticle collagen 13-like [Sapajus apella]|uniref:Cuticle collagen 13-like n=1 Tax=Sapajus apella TaxID=9515 RepID=A0A6J3FCT8_SAPAP|nr:cuticle collagen 13-like [Sapajus apella]